MIESSRAQRLAAIASISDPSRRALFEWVVRNPAPVGRDEVAEATGMARTTVAFHLDRLVEAGLLTSRFQRRNGRTGPGAGRPAKLYTPTADEVVVAIPERHYDVVGELLAAAIEESDRSGAPARTTLAAVARETGHRMGAASASLLPALENAGYEPRAAGNGRIVLENCPFHRLAANHTALICHANLCLLQGMLDGTAEGVFEVEFDPGEGHCCVTVTTNG